MKISEIKWVHCELSTHLDSHHHNAHAGHTGKPNHPHFLGCLHSPSQSCFPSPQLAFSSILSPGSHLRLPRSSRLDSPQWGSIPWEPDKPYPPSRWLWLEYFITATERKLKLGVWQSFNHRVKIGGKYVRNWVTIEGTLTILSMVDIGHGRVNGRWPQKRESEMGRAWSAHVYCHTLVSVLDFLNNVIKNHTPKGRNNPVKDLTPNTIRVSPVDMLASKSDNLSSILETHMSDRTDASEFALWHPHEYCGVCGPHTCTHIQNPK